MNHDDLKRFADDLRDKAGLCVNLELDPSPDGLHILTVGETDFYFYADGSGYDGWGQAIAKNKGGKC